MDRSVIRSDQLHSLDTWIVSEAYEEVTSAIQLARIEQDHMELCKLLVDREIVGAELDRRFDLLLGGQGSASR